MISLTVTRWNRTWGPLSETAMRERLQSLGYSVATYCYESGTVFPMHTHEVDQQDAVLSGALRICREGGSVVLTPGDTIEIPAGARHSAEVIGNETVVSLDAVKASSTCKK